MNSVGHGWCYAAVMAAMACLFSLPSATGMPRSRRNDLILQPLEKTAFRGDDVTFTCFYPENVTFLWDYGEGVPTVSFEEGFLNKTGHPIYFSRILLKSVNHPMSIVCSVNNSSLFVQGVMIVQRRRSKINEICTNDDDCITKDAACQFGVCHCQKDNVLLRLSETGDEVCRKLSYRLYDPCEFSEECFHLVDSKSICDLSHVCVCASWAAEVNGKCVSKSEINYNKNQELYRVGLVAITCLIIIIVAISLWITLRKSCLQRGTIRSNMSEDINQDTATTPTDDKPPSYNDALEATDTVSSPPNFKDALINSMTAKRLLRQVSAPAGQLLSRATSLDLMKKNNTSSQNSKQKG